MANLHHEERDMRISALGFARIRDNNGQYCLLVNKGRLTRGKGRILTPVGGGLEAHAEGKAYLALLSASDFERGGDLRFRVPDPKLADVIAWFKRRFGRETSVRRELTEELTAEIEVLDPADLEGLSEQLVGYFQFYDVTTRDVPEKQTTYLIEVFDVTLGPQAMNKLLAAASRPIADRWVYFVTRDELEQRLTHEGVAIGPVSQFIV